MQPGAATQNIEDRLYFKPFCQTHITQDHPVTVVSILARCGRPLTPQPTNYIGKHHKTGAAA